HTIGRWRDAGQFWRARMHGGPKPEDQRVRRAPAGSSMFNIVHVTHEAVYKVGGIGTVLEGLINSRHYRDSVGRTVLVCPLFYPENPQRLGPGGVIEYSSLDQQFDGPFADALGRIENEFNIRIVYGHRPIDDAPTARRTMCEVLLVDIRGINRERVNE